VLILLDLFGTLVDISPVNRRIYEFFRIYAGRDIDYDEFRDFYIRKYYEIFSDLDKKPYMVERYLFNTLYSELLNYLGVSKSPDFVVGFVYGLLASLPHFDDVSCVSRLKDKGHTLWILSNSDSDYSVPLVKTLPFEVDGITTAAMAKAYKPHERIFHFALDAAGFSPSESIMVGDSLSDIEGASRVGMPGVLIDRQGKYEDFKGQKITSLCQLEEVISGAI